MSHSKNVLGGSLLTCSTDPMTGMTNTILPEFFGDFILVNLVSDTATSGGLLTVESVRDKSVRVCAVAGPFPPAPR